MPYLLDTNILLRSVNAADALYPVTIAALLKIAATGDSVYITPQNLIEFRHVATRPASANGLGWTATQTATMTATLEARFAMLPDAPAIFSHWKALVNWTGTTGRPVHDARLAAVALSYGIAQVLTFNGGDFTRYIPHGVSPVDPATL